MQFGFLPGRSTTDAVFVMRILQENFQAKSETKVYFGFMVLKKAFDRVPREKIGWAIRKRNSG